MKEVFLHWNTIRTRYLWRIKVHYDFLIILWVTEIPCSFILVLEGKAGKGMPENLILKFLDKFLGSNFALIDGEDNIFRSLNRRGAEDFLLLRALLAICQKPREPSFWKVMDTFYFICKCTSSSFKNPFVTITSLPELCFRFRRYISWCKQKKWFRWTMAAAQAA